MNKRVLLVDNALDRSLFHPIREWTMHFGNVPFDSVHAPSGSDIPALDRYSHILLTSSEASFRQPEPWFDVEADLVRRAADQGRVVLGSGFGHQMLAWALSGPQFVRSARMPELGWVAIDITGTDRLLQGLPNPWHVYTCHTDEVVLPPDPWRVLASNTACSVQVMRFGDQPIWGIQPHPETTPDEAKAQMGAGIEAFPRYAQHIRQTIIESPVRDDGVASQLVQSFLSSKPSSRRAS